MFEYFEDSEEPHRSMGEEKYINPIKSLFIKFIKIYIKEKIAVLFLPVRRETYTENSTITICIN